MANLQEVTFKNVPIAGFEEQVGVILLAGGYELTP